jgi:hypothetical protein
VISSGRAYVNGILCENEQNGLALTAQPDLPNFALPSAAGRYVAYLDVWEREITALEDPGIREIALGGADTCTRTKTVWQIKLVAGGPAGGQFSCGTALPSLDTLTPTGTGTLAAQAAPTQTSTDPCTIAPSAGYTGLENQLYRVEIFSGGSAAQATFTWARDNASNAAGWTAQNGNVLSVSAANGATFTSGQWVELTDDTHVLAGTRGILVRLVTVSGSTLTFDPNSAIAPAPPPASATGPAPVAPAAAPVTVSLNNFQVNPKVIGWNSSGAVALVAGTWVNLENGLQVEFSNGTATYRTGDYWQIPARSGIGVLWPPGATANAPLPLPPRGVFHHYLRLAVIDFDGSNWSDIQDCRLVFPSLTEVTTGARAPDALKIEQVLLASTGGALANDTTYPVSALAGGVNIVLDRAPDPNSIKAATCSVTLAVPFPLDSALATLWGSGLAGAVPLTLDAKVTVNGTTISWTPNAGAATFLQNALFQGIGTLGLPSGPVLARLVIKGRFVCLLGVSPSVNLDGTTYGTTGGSNVVTVGLPSGDGRRGGDFEMWFWLISSSGVQTTSSISFNPSPPAGGSIVAAGNQITGTITLTGPAPAGGLTVSLSTVVSDPSHASIAGAVTLPASVTIAAGATSASFTIGLTAFTLTGVNPTAAQKAALMRTMTLTATSSAGTSTAQLLLAPEVINTHY